MQVRVFMALGSILNSRVVLTQYEAEMSIISLLIPSLPSKIYL